MATYLLRYKTQLAEFQENWSNHLKTDLKTHVFGQSLILYPWLSDMTASVDHKVLSQDQLA